MHVLKVPSQISLCNHAHALNPFFTEHGTYACVPEVKLIASQLKRLHNATGTFSSCCICVTHFRVHKLPAVCCSPMGIYNPYWSNTHTHGLHFLLISDHNVHECTSNKKICCNTEGVTLLWTSIALFTILHTLPFTRSNVQASWRWPCTYCFHTYVWFTFL